MNSFSFEGKFERVPPANFAEKIGIPSGWIVVNHNYISNKAHRRVAHGEWFEISSNRAKIYRLLRFSPRLQKGDETKSGQIVVDWIGWIDLHDRDENVSNSISLKVRRLPWWRRPLAYLKHPDPAVRLSGWLGWASVILGSIALLLALPYAWIGQKLGALASATCFMLALTCGDPIPAGPTSDAGSTSTELGTEVPAAPPVEQPQMTALDRGSNELHFSSLACEDHLPYGAPAEIATPDGDRVTVCQWSGDDQQAFFVSRYDRSRVSTDWTAYTLTREMMLAVAQSEIVRREHGVNFQRDPQIETESFRSPVHGSLTGIGNLSPAHDRGHLAPAEPFKWSLEGYQRTFIVSNIAIQAGWFNQQLWQDVEAQVQGWACDLGTVHIVTGVVYGDEPATFALKQREDVSHIPEHFYVAAYTPHEGGHAVAIIFPNIVPPVGQRDITPAAGAISIAELETRTGLDFHPDMDPDHQAMIEAVLPAESIWRFDYPRNFQCRD